MKVLHILDSLNHGGKEILALDLCRNAKANELDLTFVATSSGDLEKHFRNSVVEFIRLQRKFPVDPFVISKLRSIIKSKNIGIIHAHQAVEGLHAYLATRGLKTKVVLSYHGYIPQAKKDNKVLEFLAPRIDANIAVSNGFIERLKEQSNIKNLSDFYVIYNGIDEKKLLNEFDRNNNVREELNLPQNGFLAGMVGNFQSWKDQLTICKAMASILTRIPSFHFIFVGGKVKSTPEYYDNCHRFCEENNLLTNIHFLGKRDDVPSILNKLDLFVFSTIEDTFGIAVVEAMLMGVPTISSDIPPLKEVTNNGEFGLLFNTANENDLATKIIELVNDKKKLEKFSLLGKEWAIKNFTIKTYINNLIELYNGVLNVY